MAAGQDDQGGMVRRLRQQGFCFMQGCFGDNVTSVALIRVDLLLSK
jgi:hypothetical protein